MHLSDGILPVPLLAAGFVLAGGLAALGGRSLRDEETPRVAVFTGAFFCASLIHFKLPPTSVHLMFCGLLGVVLGRRALVAIPVGLGLQAALLGHGGLTALGVNAVMFDLAALAAAAVYHRLANRQALGGFWAGAAASAVAVLVSGVMLTAVLTTLGEGFRRVAQYAFVAHAPILVLEALVTGFAVEFLQRVQPALLSRTSA